MDINFSELELDWLNNYAGNHDLTVEATVRLALRMLSLIEGTPGAREALSRMSSEHLGLRPKYDPMPPLPGE